MESKLFQIANSTHFVWIALFGTAMLGLSQIFGGGHEHDSGHDGGVDHDHDGDANMSVLSFKVLWMFTVGFGAGGFFAARTGLDILTSSIWGIAVGVVMAGLGYFLMNYLYKHQGSSVIKVESAIGLHAVVDTAIEPGKFGEVHCTVGGRVEYFQACSTSGTFIPSATLVLVTKAIGNMLVVEKEENN